MKHPWLRRLLTCALACSLVAVLGGCSTPTPSGDQPATETPDTAPPVKSTSFRVMSFNVWYKNEESQTVKNTADTADVRVSLRAPRLLEMMETENVAIAGLQEVGPAWIYYFNQNPPEKYAIVGRYTKSTQEGGYILYDKTRFELLEYDYFWLAPDMPKEAVKGWDSDHDRMVNWAVFREKESGVILLFCDTHFDNGGAQARLESAKLVNAWLPEKVEQIRNAYSLAEVPAFLVGDLNSEPTSDSYLELSKVMTDARHAATGDTLSDTATSSPGLTWLESDGQLPETGHFIDHIFFLGPVAVHSTKMVLTATNLCPYGAYLSDHNALFADVTLTN